MIIIIIIIIIIILIIIIMIIIIRNTIITQGICNTRNLITKKILVARKMPPMRGFIKFC